jgi:hypothetical protein
MATTPAGTVLTQAQQRGQLTLRSAALQEALKLYPIWDLEDIDGTWEPFMTGLLAVIEKYHQVSTRQAGAYYTTLRRAEGVPGTIPVKLATFDRERVVANLTLLGPIFAKKAISLGRSREAERRVALVRLSGVVTAMVLAGSRETIQATQADDPAARGYLRVITGTCEFCRNLAAAGANVGEFKAHSNCGCVAEPAFGQVQEAPRTEEELRQWDAAHPTDPERILRVLASREISREALGEGAQGVVSRIVVDGRRGQEVMVHKLYKGTDKEIRDAMDAEVLTARLAEKIGAPVPKVAISGPTEMVQEFVDIPATTSFWDAKAAAQAQGSRELGLLDFLTAQEDRAGSNLFFDGDRVVGIDHGFSWYTVGRRYRSPGFSPFIDEYFELAVEERNLVGAKTAAYTQAELAQIELSIRSLQADFESFGRLDWYTETLDRLHMLREAS